MEDKSKIDLIKQCFKRYPDFPKPGIEFLDIFPLLRNAKAFQALLEILSSHARKLEIDVVAGLESRGFLFGATLALRLGVSFVPIRKKGKLPGKVNQIKYKLEYGEDIFEVQTDSILPKQKVILVDDLLATGGSLMASCQLISQLDAEVVECLVVVEIADLKGRDKLPVPVHSIVQEHS